MIDVACKRKMGTAYIAGPMSSYPLYNFLAFDECRDGLLEAGWEVISPADLDRSVGFDPATSVVTKGFLDEAMERDIEAIMRVDAMVMLPNWQKSVGATAEYHLAKWRHIPVYQWPSMERVVDAEVPVMQQAVMNDPLPDSAGDHINFVTYPQDDVSSDPKKTAGDKKCPMHLLPPVALRETAWVHKLGADKYGEWNWAVTGISLDTYVGAIMRHLMAMHDGEWFDPESGRPHAAHIACSCNILMDADDINKLER